MELQHWDSAEAGHLERALEFAGLTDTGPTLRATARSLVALTSDLRRAVGSAGEEMPAALRYFEAMRLLRALDGQAHPFGTCAGAPEEFLAKLKLARYKDDLISRCGMAMDDVAAATDSDLERAGITAQAHRNRFLKAACKEPLHYRDCDGDVVTFRLADSDSKLQKVVNGGNPKVNPSLRSPPSVCVPAAPIVLLQRGLCLVVRISTCVGVTQRVCVCVAHRRSRH
jgi:hypothetical protein